ncbi:MAG: hypothetical protein ACSHW1_16960 [Yoonia sp.]|uniref:hypothetical protein n=1 Tax=Yoonia sp. TaxID=2212373 RepID=UPI003EF20FE4
MTTGYGNHPARLNSNSSDKTLKGIQQSQRRNRSALVMKNWPCRPRVQILKFLGVTHDKHARDFLDTGGSKRQTPIFFEFFDIKQKFFAGAPVK